jgi:hypothetical protein
MGDRYYLMPMLDGWTGVFQVPGKRTTGDKAQAYAITGPGWSGTACRGHGIEVTQGSYGFSVGSTAPALPRITPKCTRCRTSSL